MELFLRVAKVRSVLRIDGICGDPRIKHERFFGVDFGVTT